MSAPTFRALPLESSTPWDQWSGELAEAGEWAARTLARVLLAPLAWLVRPLSQMHWGSGDALVSAVVLGMPAVALASWATRVVWPTWEQALVDLQHLAVVLGVTYLALTITRVQHAGGAGGAASDRVCRTSGHSHGVVDRRQVQGPAAGGDGAAGDRKSVV